MKNLLLLLLVLPILFGCDNGNDKRDDNGNVNISDANFKIYLVGNTAINTNGDSEIQVSEASTFNGVINCNSMNISNLKGIEAFTDLTVLYCSENQLTSLDVSKNTALTFLSCNENQLTSLDVSKNLFLSGLLFGFNQLTSLDVSKNAALTELNCGSNQLKSLDVSKNTALTWLICVNNKLTSLDVSKNTALTKLLCCGNQFNCDALERW
jgi:Leucine-rich repeat (LRR) protein